MKLTGIILALFLTATAAAQNITRIEYFIDIDPGYGSATSVSFTTGTAVTTNVAVNLPATIPDGFHFLSVRAKDANNKWSVVSTRSFVKQTLPITSKPAITAIEYFIDTDPGYGLATAVSGITSSMNVTQSIQIPLSTTVATGFHNLNIRVKDATNKWSVVSTRPFYKESLAGSLPNITAVEYFIDTDPGYGLATPVSGLTATSGVSKDFIINMGSLPQGAHKLWIRAKDANNKWSFVQVKEFFVQPNVITVGDLPDVSCRSVVFKVPFKVNDAYSAGNVFTAQLSNDKGDFTYPTVLGTVTGTQSDTILAVVPRNMPVGRKGYQLRVVSSSPAALNGAPKPVTLETDIFISSQPVASATVTVGNTASAAVSATGGVVNYQWYTGNTINAGLVSGQTSATLVLDNVQENQSGVYYCLVNSYCSSKWSSGFSLTVQKNCANLYPNGLNTPPVLTVTSSSTNVCVGSAIQLTCNVINEDLSYQWNGATTMYPTSEGICTFTSSSGLNSYSVIISNSTGCSVVASITLQAINLFSVKNGDWNDPSVWSCQRIPTGNDVVTISSAHVVSLTATGEAKYLVINGRITYGLNAQLYVGGTKINNLIISESRDVTTQTVPTSGKEIIVSGVDPSINGFKIQVPGGAYPASKTFKVSYATVLNHNLGVDFKPISPLINVENGGGYADSLMKVTIPIQLPSNHIAIVMKYEAGKGFDLLPTVASSATEITVLTNHFGPGTGSVANGKTATESVLINNGKNLIAFAFPQENNQVSITDFRPGIDGWEFVNDGSSAKLGSIEEAKEGICAGMSVTAMWYHKYKKSIGNGPLFKNPIFQKYDPLGSLTDKVWQDNTLGIKFASTVQVEVGFTLEQSKSAFKSAETNKVENDLRILNCLRGFFKLQKQPCYLAMFTEKLNGQRDGHAVIVYGVDSQGLLIADPNKPGKVSKVPYTTSGFSYRGGRRADGTPVDFEYFFCYEPDFVDPNYLENKWKEVRPEPPGLPTIGDAYFPKSIPQLPYLINQNPDYEIGKPNLVVKGRINVIYTMPDLGYSTTLVTTQGGSIPNSANWFQPTIGKHELGLYAYKKDTRDGKPVKLWSDFKWFDVDVQQPNILIDSPLITKVGVANKAYSFSISGSDKPGLGAIYSWNFGDNASDSGENKDLVTHPFKKAGIYSVKVEVRNAVGTTPEFYYEVVATVEVISPTVSTQQVINLIPGQAQVQGYIQQYKKGNVGSYGICWSSLNPQPTINEPTKVEYPADPNLPEDKPFSATATGLSVGTTYYVRTYIKTGTNTIYGNTRKFTHNFNFDPSLVAGEYTLVSITKPSSENSGTAILTSSGWFIQLWFNSTKTGTPWFSNSGSISYSGVSTEPLSFPADCQCAPCYLSDFIYCESLPPGRLFNGNAGGAPTPQPLFSFTDDAQSFTSRVAGNTVWVKVR